MENLVTQTGLEMQALSPGDIVTPVPRDPKFSYGGNIVKVIAANAAVVVVERFHGGDLFKGRRDTLEMRSYRFYEAASLLEAMEGDQ